MFSKELFLRKEKRRDLNLDDMECVCYEMYIPSESRINKWSNWNGGLKREEIVNIIPLLSLLVSVTRSAILFTEDKYVR